MSVMDSWSSGYVSAESICFREDEQTSLSHGEGPRFKSGRVHYIIRMINYDN